MDTWLRLYVTQRKSGNTELNERNEKKRGWQKISSACLLTDFEEWREGGGGRKRVAKFCCCYLIGSGERRKKKKEEISTYHM